MQMPFIFSEKGNGLNLTPFAHVRQVRDNLNTESCRLVDPDLILPFLYDILLVINEVDSPKVTLVLGPGALFCTCGAYLLSDCSILPRGFRLMLNDLQCNVMNGLYNSMDRLMESPMEARELSDSAPDVGFIGPEALGILTTHSKSEDKFPYIVREHSAANAVRSMVTRSMCEAAGVVLKQFGCNRLIKHLFKHPLSPYGTSEFYKYK